MKNKETIILIIILVALILISGGVLGYKIYTKKIEEKEVTNLDEDINNEVQQEESEPIVIEPPKQIEIYNGDERPIAVMLDNHTGAWPHVALNQAYLVYEIIVEGAETRLMALFKGKDLSQIGSVRSSRHYFLDYALENDALYVHFGWSPQAERDIKTLGVNNINGITESSSNFWRTKKKSSPHNVETSTESILKIAERKGYKTTSSNDSVLNYTVDEVNLENGTDAIEITIPHSSSQKVRYEYNPEIGKYTRYARNKLQTDGETGEDIITKNIIITFCDNYTLKDSENKGRQGLNNIGTFKGYYITNGKAIEIQCTKNSRSQQTIYKDLEGNEINVNDGNTFIHIVPQSAKVEIIGGNENEENLEN